MKNTFTSYKKIISIVCLGAYLFVSGYSLFHLHNTNYFLEDAINVEGKAYTDSKFHQNSFCQIFHFNYNQLSGSCHLDCVFTPSELFIDPDTLPLSLISPEINSLLRRGPPSLV